VAETTTIEWTRNDDGTPGRTWNPVTGCTKISAGCDNCYAETIAERFRGTAAFPHGFDVRVRSDKVNAPLKWRKPTRVFVNSMSDLFHADVDQAWIADIFAVMAAARRHTFQLLTKRHARMRSLLNDPNFVENVRKSAHGKGLPADQWQWPLPNLWLGVSVENQKWADIRIPALLDTPATVRFLSCEPLLGPIELFAGDHSTHERDFDGTDDYICLDCSTDAQHVPWRVIDRTNLGIDWVIVGGESGRKARPMAPQWATSLRDQCEAAGVPFFFKQWGEYAPTGYVVIGGTSKGTLLVGEPVDDLGHRVELARVGKKNAGRELDGRTHDAFPAVAQ
jgi:protein gp37